MMISLLITVIVIVIFALFMMYYTKGCRKGLDLIISGGKVRKLRYEGQHYFLFSSDRVITWEEDSNYSVRDSARDFSEFVASQGLTIPIETLEDILPPHITNTLFGRTALDIDIDEYMYECVDMSWYSGIALVLWHELAVKMRQEAYV